MNAVFAIAASLVCLLPLEPQDRTVSAAVDVLELNHFRGHVDSWGDYVSGGVQIIAWDCSNYGYTPVGWVLELDKKEIVGHTLTWEKSGKRCVLSAEVWVETFTPDDPEVEHRKIVPEAWRRRVKVIQYR